MTTQPLQEQARPKPKQTASRPPLQLFFIVAISTMIAETGVMFSFELLPRMPQLVENFVDGALLAILLSPILYQFLFRPLNEHVAALAQAERSLRRANNELEKKVQERTQQLLAVQDELVRNEKLALLGQVADTVGHELRNPLGVMNNAVHSLQNAHADADETTRKYLGIIKNEIADAERIVSDLLDTVRTNPSHPGMVVVADLVGQILRKYVVPSTVTVRLDIPETLSIWVDQAQIYRVFRNLISNGVEAMPGGGTLEIKAGEDKAAKTVTVSIKDSGSGIAPEHQAKLFQPMFTTKARRVGLGLVVVKSLTQANSGSVEVESVPGNGSVFTVTLPCGGY